MKVKEHAGIHVDGVEVYFDIRAHPSLCDDDTDVKDAVDVLEAVVEAIDAMGEDREFNDVTLAVDETERDGSENWVDEAVAEDLIDDE